jgi:hypothetical protein
MVMSDSTTKGELHLRVTGHMTDWKLLLVDDGACTSERTFAAATRQVTRPYGHVE